MWTPAPLIVRPYKCTLYPSIQWSLIFHNLLLLWRRHKSMQEWNELSSSIQFLFNCSLVAAYLRQILWLIRLKILLTDGLIITVSGNIRPHWEIIQILPFPSLTLPFLRVKPQVPRSFYVPAALLAVILLAVRQGSPPQTHQSSPNPFSYSFTRAHMIRI